MVGRTTNPVLVVCVSLTFLLSGALQEPPAAATVQDELFVATVPAGLKVYLSPDADAGKTARRDPEDGTPLVEKHEAIDESNLKGVTPLSLSLTPGNYLLAIGPIMLFDENYRIGTIDPSQDARAFVSFEPLGPKVAASFKDGLTGAAIYEVTKHPSARQVVVVLACGWDTTLEMLEADYPKGANFSFDDLQLRKDLIEAKLPDSDLDRVIALLSRGGRVWLPRGDLGWSVAIDSDGKATIKTKVRTNE